MFHKRGSTDLMRSAQLLPVGSSTVFGPDKVKINYISPHNNRVKKKRETKSKKLEKNSQRDMFSQHSLYEEPKSHKFVPL